MGKKGDVAMAQSNQMFRGHSAYFYIVTDDGRHVLSAKIVVKNDCWNLLLQKPPITGGLFKALERTDDQPIDMMADEGPDLRGIGRGSIAFFGASRPSQWR